MSVINPFGESRYPTEEVKTVVDWHSGTSRPDVSDMGLERVYREEYEGRFLPESVRDSDVKPRLKTAPARYSIDTYSALKMIDTVKGSSYITIQAELERRAKESLAQMVNPACLRCHAMKFEAYRVASTNREVYAMNCEYGERAVCPDEATVEMRFDDWDKIPVINPRPEKMNMSKEPTEPAKVKPEVTNDIRSDFGSW